MKDWNNLEYWNAIESPITPTQIVVDDFKTIIGDVQSTLVLGITKQLYNISPETTTLERDKVRISLFPTTDKIIEGDWFNASRYIKYVDCVIGDGSLSYVSINEYQGLIKEMKKIATDKVVVRIYESPEVRKTIKQIVDDVKNGVTLTFSALKLDLAMYLSVERIDVSLNDIYNLYKSVFINTDNLIQMTGWDAKSIDVIEVYNGIRTRHSFPTQKKMLQLFPKAERIKSTGYQLSDRCPFYCF